MKLPIVNVPSLQKPIQESPGFAKKELADYKLDLMGSCFFQCAYCSTAATTYHRTVRAPWGDMAEQQTGQRLQLGKDPVTFQWPDVLDKLAAQLANKPKSWGAGKTLVVSMLTDAFSPLTVANGTTRTALDMVLDKTSFRIRVLTKSAIVGSDEWVGFFSAHPGRFVVGLSIGTLDHEWARVVEVGTSSPSARIRAHQRLQDSGIPTFGMLCPVFPDAMDRLDDLLSVIRPERCETVWAEPYNDRANWRAVASGYPDNGRWATWLKRVYEDGDKGLWSDYAASLYGRLRKHAVIAGWLNKLRYLLYEGDICEADAPSLSDLSGVLLQSKPGEDGFSRNPHVAALQRGRS